MKSNDFKYQLIVFFLPIFIYANSIYNGYALDDEYIINNPHIKKGIFGILDIFKSKYSTNPDSSFGYRPITTLSFAIEHSLFKFSAQKSHLVNVILFTTTSSLLYNVLKKIFWNYSTVLSFVSVLIFISHPIHTEVVASIKSRDEILSLLFGLISLNSFLKYVLTSKKHQLIPGVIGLVCACLSKTTGFVFFLIIPLSIWFIPNKTLAWSKIILSLGVSIIFIPLIVIPFIGYNIESDRVFSFIENPLYYSPFIDRLPASIITLGYYLKLLILPHPLAYYYGYNVVPILNASFFTTLPILLIHISLFIFAIVKLKEKHILSYSILFYLIGIAGFTNIIAIVPGIIGERLAYTASVGFCIGLAWIILKLFKHPIDQSDYTSNSFKRNTFWVFVFISISASTSVTVNRNFNWKNKLTLYSHDIQYLENSAKAHSLLADELMNHVRKSNKTKESEKQLQKAVHHYRRSLEIYPEYVSSLNNLGVVYSDYLNDYQTAIKLFKKAIKFDSKNLNSYTNLCHNYHLINQPDSAIYYGESAINIDSSFVESYNQLTKIYNSRCDYNLSLKVNSNALKKVKIKTDILFNIAETYLQMGDTISGIQTFQKALTFDSNNYYLAEHISELCFLTGNKHEAEKFQNIAVQILAKKE